MKSLQENLVVGALPEVREANEQEGDLEEELTTTDDVAPAPWTLDQHEVDRLFWRDYTESVLYPQDQAAWGAGFLFLCFIVNTMGADPAYIICGLQMAIQLVWMARWPASYKANRDNICLGIRIWRIYINSRLCSRFAFQSQDAKPLIRSLLIASGALVNCIVSLGYQLKLSAHAKLQLVALLVSLAAGTSSVTAFVSLPQHRAATQRIYATLSDASAFLLEGVNFPGHRKLGYTPDAGLAVVLMAQLYVGCLAPTYLLHALERAARLRFRAHLRALATCAPDAAPAPLPPATAVDAFYAALFGVLTHVLVLALAATALWEVLCCATSLLHHAPPLPDLGQRPLLHALALLLPNTTLPAPAAA